MTIHVVDTDQEELRLTELFNRFLEDHKLPKKSADELLVDFHFGTFDSTHNDISFYEGWLSGFLTMWNAWENLD